ncbi:MAG: hypothetical protein Q4F35_07500 [Akkermansia sp.]|nr:hypothetical protein [Akkermansia sp.]
MPDNNEDKPSQAVAAAAAEDTQRLSDSEPETVVMPVAVTDADGAFTPDWYKQFAELQPYATTLGKFRRPEALAKSYAMLERMKGYPDVHDERRMAAFRTAVGLPAEAEGYAIPRPENTPDELWDPALAASISQVAYEYGVPAPAMAALCERYAEEGRRMLLAGHEAEAAAIAGADAELQQEWGRRYDDNMQMVSNFLTQLGERAGVDVQELTTAPSLRANADFARLMLAAATLLEEAPMHTGSPGDSRDEARRIANDPAHPLHEAYMRTSHPRHRYANEQYDRLAFGHPL